MSNQTINIFLERLAEYEGEFFHTDITGIETAPLGIVIANKQNQSIANSLDITLDKNISLSNAKKIVRERAKQDFTELSNALGDNFTQLNPKYQAIVLDAKFNTGVNYSNLAKNLNNFQSSPTSDNRTAVVNESRRVVDGKPVRGLDNRVYKVLYDSGVVSSLADVQSKLSLANTTDRQPKAKDKRDDTSDSLTMAESVTGTIPTRPPVPETMKPVGEPKFVGTSEAQPEIITERTQQLRPPVPDAPLPIGTMEFTGTSEAQPEPTQAEIVPTQPEIIKDERIAQSTIETVKQETEKRETGILPSVTTPDEFIIIDETEEEKQEREKNTAIIESVSIGIDTPEFSQLPDSFNIKKSIPSFPTKISAQELKSQEPLEVQEKPSKLNFEIIKNIVAEDWMISYALQGNEDLEPDPNFVFTPELQEEILEGINPDYQLDILENSLSEGQARSLKEEALRKQKFDEEISSLGWKGVLARMGLTVADPFAIFVALGTEGVAAPLVFGNKLSRLGKIIRGATGAGVTNGAIESYLVSQNEFKDPYDVLYAISAGVLLGGGIGSLGRNDNVDPVNKALAKIARHADNSQKIEVTEALNREVLDDTEQLSVGAAVNPDSLPNQIKDRRSDVDDFLDDLTDGEEVRPAFDDLPIPVSFDMTNALLRSPNRIANYLGRILGENPIGFTQDKNIVSKDTADRIKGTNLRLYTQSYLRTYDIAYKDWAKSEKINVASRMFNVPRRQFGELVADAIEAKNFDGTPVGRAAKKQADLQSEILKESKRVRLEGFENIPEDLSYFSHLWDSIKFDDSEIRFGTDKLIKLLSGSLIRGTEDLTEEAANALATGMANKLRLASSGMDGGASRLFNAQDRDVMRNILIDEEFMSEEQADSFLALFAQKPNGKIARAKRRLRFDMNHSIQVKTKQGKIETLRIKDLQDRDAEQVFLQYAAELSGRNAMAEIGIPSERMFNKIVDRLRAEAGDREGASGRKRADKDVLIAQTMFNMIINRKAPLAADPSGTYARTARLVKDYNFLRLMGQVGFPQIGELGNAVSIGGVRGLLQAIPEFSKTIKRMKDGELLDPFSREVENIFGIGGERLTNQAMNRVDPHAVFSEGRGDFLDKALFALQPMKRFIADASGLAPITSGLERMTARIVLQKFTDMAFGEKNLGLFMGKQKTRQRLAMLGIDDVIKNEDGNTMLDRILSQIRTHSITQPSAIFGNRKVKFSNMVGFDDDEARRVLTTAVVRWSRRAIQQNDVGNLALFMTDTTATILTQFRTFMLVSHSKQFLHNIKANDFQAYSAMMFGCLFAGLSYATQQHLNAIGRADKEEFLAERLSSESIGKAAFQRSSWAALFPALVDTGAMFFTDDPYFAYRSSGLSADFITGNPSVQLVGRGINSVQALSRSALNPDLQYSQGQARALASIVPLNNALIIKNIINKLIEDLPTTTKVE